MFIIAKAVPVGERRAGRCNRPPTGEVDSGVRGAQTSPLDRDREACILKA